MSTTTNKIQEHPAESITGFVGAVMALLIAFGVPFTEAQVAAIIGVFGFLPAGVTWVVNFRRTRAAQ